MKEWFVLEHSVKPGVPVSDDEEQYRSEMDDGWQKVMSLGGWDDPARRAAVLRDFRQTESLGTRYRMVRYTAEVLPE